MHFKLYEGYVKATNTLNEHIANILKDGSNVNWDVVAKRQ